MPFSRLVVDPERFKDDSKESMAEKGMGVIYTKTSEGKPLRRSMSGEDRQLLLDKYYDCHHRNVESAVCAVLAESGRCLIIDAHSFSSRPLPHEEDQSADRPSVCVGTDDYHTPEWVKNNVVEALKKEFVTVKINSPFSGAFVPEKYFKNDRRVSSVMIELNRSLYMDETSGARSEEFGEIKNRIINVILRLKTCMCS